MTSTILNPINQQEWINSFDPKKRIFVGRSYVFVKRVMDLSIVLLSAPFWIPVLGIIAVIIRLTSPGVSDRKRWQAL
jgi:lipopolysaccharide/colanic/teichoic acid biosynthesis glycosyltransferase